MVLKFALDDALKAHRAEIEEHPGKYGVPLVKCPDCLVPGDLPANGSYMLPMSVAHVREQADALDGLARTGRPVAGEGSSINKELDDAVVANDVDRAAYLIGKGASVNELDNLGSRRWRRPRAPAASR